jgi:hypothetical protein
MLRIPTQSSLFKSYGYNKDRLSFEIEFIDETIVSYYEVPFEKYDLWQSQETDKKRIDFFKAEIQAKHQGIRTR